jgi:hypothetical protein
MLAKVKKVSSAMRLRWSVMARSRLSSIVFASPLRFLCPKEIQSPCPNGRWRPNRVCGPVRAIGSRRRDAVSPQSNARRGVAATLALAGAIIAGLPGLTQAAPAQRGQPGDQAPEPTDSGEVISAWLTLRRWVDAFSLPGLNDANSGTPLTDAAGVCVILRQSGRVVGTGIDSSGGYLMMRRAAGRALGEVLADPAAVNLRERQASPSGRGLAVELEVAGPLVPLLGRSFDDLAGQLDPGLDGVAMRRGERFAMAFPAQMRATNTAGRVERAVSTLTLELGLTPARLAELTRRFDVSVYRFRTVHMAQPAPGGPPFITFRGDDLVLAQDVTQPSLVDLARGIAEHLMGSGAPVEEPVGLLGTYRPTSDHYDPLIAPPLEQALAAWALARYGRLHGDAEPAARQAAEVAGRVLADLAQVAPGESDPQADTAVCAAIVIAVLEHPDLRGHTEVPELLARARDRVRAAYTRENGFAHLEDAPVTPNGQALIAWALSRLLVTGSVDLDAGFVRSAIDTAWASAPEPRQISLMPWLGWAEADYAAATGGPIANAQRLQKIRRLADASRVGSPDRPGPADLAGGLVLTGGDRLTATAQTLRPAAFLAWMVRQPELTPRFDEAVAALDRTLATARFAMQLSVREPSAWAYRNRGRALGGIRAAAWDCNQPVAAQALGLVFAAETLASIDAVAGRRGGSPGTP